MPMYSVRAEDHKLISNDYINISVEPTNGRYTIGTEEGSPYRLEDQNKPLLYEKGNLDTSFTTFRIDGVDYIYGNTYDNGGFTELPRKDNNGYVSTWHISDVFITQRLDIDPNIDSPTSGNVKISYNVHNKGVKDVAVGSRILLDTKIGTDDGSYIQLPNKSYIKWETEFLGEEVPDYYTVVQTSNELNIVAYNDLKGWENSKPDKLIFAHWNGLSSSKWDYTIDSTRNVTSHKNKYNKPDSACALYWNPLIIQPNGEKVFQTVYGLGTFTMEENLDFSATLKAPTKLEGNGEKGEAFTLSLEIDNDTANAKKMIDTTVSLILPSGLSLSEGNEMEQHIRVINKGDMTQRSWEISANYGERIQSYEYAVKITTLGKEQKIIKKRIIVPGKKMTAPEVYYTDYGPKILSEEDENKFVMIKGSGFQLLSDKSSWSLYLSEDGDAQRIYIPVDDIEVLDNHSIRVRLSNKVAASGYGERVYSLNIEHTYNSDFNYTIQSGITVSKDNRYVPKVYKSLVIGEQTINGTKKYYTHMNDTKVVKNQEERILLKLEGHITQLGKDTYTVVVADNSVRINDVLYYEGEDINITLTSTRDGINYDGVNLSGYGSISSQIARGVPGKTQLLKGRITYDYDSYTLELDKTIGYEERIIQLGVLPLVVNGITLSPKQDVQLDAEFCLSTDRIANLLPEYSIEPIRKDLEGIKITDTGIQLNSKVDIDLPPMVIGSFKTKIGKPSYLVINTDKNEYGFTTTWENTSLRLDELTGELYFNSNWQPTTLKVDGVFKTPRPIGSSGMGIKSVSGGVYGLEKVLNHRVQDMKLVAGCHVEDMITGGIKIDGKSFLNADVKGTLTERGIEFVGEGSLYMVPLANVKGNIWRDGAHVYGTINILDVIEGNTNINIEPTKASGKLAGSLKIPGKYPIVGGEKVGGVDAGISNESIYTSFSLMRCDVGVKYTWGNSSVSFDIDTPVSIPFAVHNSVDYAHLSNGDTRIDFNMVSVPIGDIAYTGDMSLLGVGDKKSTYESNLIFDDMENVLLQIRYEGEIPPNVQLITPDKKPYILQWEGESADPNARHHVIPASESISGQEERYIGIVIVHPSKGIWKMESDGEIELKAFDILDLPSIHKLKAKKIGNSIEVTWDSTQNDTSLDFYLVSDTEQNTYSLIKNVESSLEKIKVEIPKDAPTGEYHVKVISRRGEFGYKEFISNDMSYNNPHEPSKPTGFKLESIGNGNLRAIWNKPTYTPTKYVLRPIDEAGNILDKGDTIILQGSEKTQGNKYIVDFGGTYEEKGGLIHGWVTNQNYKLELVAVKEEEGYTYYSDPATAKLYLKEPTPPVCSISIKSTEGIIKKASHDQMTYYTNDRLIEVAVTVKEKSNCIAVLNGLTTDDIELGAAEAKSQESKVGKESLPLLLREGENSLQVVVTDLEGDETIEYFTIYCDTQSPYLSIISPAPLHVLSGDYIQVEGYVEAGANLSINSKTVVANDSGYFTVAVPKGEVKHQLEIVAKDELENKTEYIAQLLSNERLIKQVKIIVPELIKGTKAQLELEAIGEKEKWIIPSEVIDWEIIGPSHGAEIDEKGQVLIDHNEEIIIKASYKVTNTFAFQDMITVKAKNGSVTPPPDPPVVEPPENDSNNDITFRILPKAEYWKDFIIPGKDIYLNFSDFLSILIHRGSIQSKEKLEVRQLSMDKLLKLIHEDMIPASMAYSLKLDKTTKLSKGALLSIGYEEDKRYPVEQLGIYMLKDGRWHLVGSKIDEEKQTIETTVIEMGSYAVFYNENLTVMNDIAQSWAKDSINRLILKKVINGVETSEGMYYLPKKEITRSEFIKLLVNIYQRENSSASRLEESFIDETEIPTWAKSAIHYAYANKWLFGERINGRVSIKPNAVITRAEAITFLGRILNEEHDETVEFKDYDDIPHWAMTYVSNLVHNEIITGYEDNTLRPSNKMTREEAAVILDRLLTYIDK